MPQSQWRSDGARLRVPASVGGIDAVIIENELLRVTILSGKGADVCEFVHKPTDTDFMWHSPRGLVALDSDPAIEDPLNCFGEFYEGGWQELFPHASRTSKYRGVDLPQHGEVWRLPWSVEILEDAPERVCVRLSAETPLTPFRIERTLSLAAASLEMTIREKVTNLSDEEHEFLWGHHPAFGAPFLSEDCRFEIPAAKVLWRGAKGDISGDWPVVDTDEGPVDLSRVPAPDSGPSDMVYPQEIAEGKYRIVNEKRGVGFTLKWDLDLFKVIWIWRSVPVGGGDRDYTVACEPVSHMSGARERGEELLSLGGGESMETELIAGACTL